MTQSKKIRLLATLAAAMLLPVGAFAVEHGSIHTSVRDTNGNSVTSTNGNCVITKWTAATSDCKAYGNARMLTREQRTVYFDFNKSTLNAAEKKKLDSVAKIIASSKDVASVTIVGHADKIGKAGYNKALSMKRAGTVKSFLAGKGLKTNKVRVDGMGDENSVTSCDTDTSRAEKIKCMAADRRVEIELNFVK